MDPVAVKPGMGVGDADGVRLGVGMTLKAVVSGGLAVEAAYGRAPGF
jgi:hypothetical protein